MVNFYFKKIFYLLNFSFGIQGNCWIKVKAQNKESIESITKGLFFLKYLRDS